MIKFTKEALLAGVVVSLALAGSASAVLTDAQFKCQASSSKAAGKFVGSKTKCASKCIQNAGKGLNPYSDCFAPYGGTTATCIEDVLKGAEAKFAVALVKACSLNCPPCYAAQAATLGCQGDCSATGFAACQVGNIETQVDNFGPGVFCEQPGADAGETKCELNTAKVLSKQVASINKCYDKCFANARKGLINVAACAPPATDAATASCVTNASAKSILGIDKLCKTAGAIPDCAAPDDNSYPDGAGWVGIVNIAITGNTPDTYCASPSGAFVE